MFTITLSKIASPILLSFSAALLLTSSLTVKAHSAELLEPNQQAATSTQDIRLISAGAGITELVLALGGENNLIAVDASSKIPKNLRHIKQVGYHRMLSAEGLLSLHPNVLLGSDVMGPANTLALLRSADVKVISLPSATNKNELFNNIDAVSTLLAKTNNAETLKNHLSAQLNKIAKNRNQISDSHPIKVLFMLLQAGRPAKVGGADTAADIIIQLTGSQNSATFSGYKTVSQEGILSMQPDIILISSRNESTEKQDISLFPLLANMPLLASLPAYQNKHVFVIPPKALIGGLGLSAIDEAEILSQQFISLTKSALPENSQEPVE
ncbi:hemin ABC transporter substrate-binding protein [uncultured Shewanella sp.]|uniref:heme/hemin ABC transporter substrate-binding protein n=1 Tax=uncultured Shewanella sp. TaxID=173975 RepID=UPI00260277BE|nr:ABC transporter substrate-binding protein [uncultured Shewanella sp.]